MSSDITFLNFKRRTEYLSVVAETGSEQHPKCGGGAGLGAVRVLRKYRSASSLARSVSGVGSG